MSFVKDGKDLGRALVECAHKFIDLFLMLPCLSILYRCEVISDIEKLVGVLLEFFKTVINSCLRCRGVLCVKKFQEIGNLMLTSGSMTLSESGVRASAHALSQLHVHACRPELASTET